MAKKHKRIWRDVFRRMFTAESITAAVQENDLSKLVVRDDPKSVRDSLDDIAEKPRAERYDHYLTLSREMKGASADTLRKIRRRLGIEG